MRRLFSLILAITLFAGISTTTQAQQTRYQGEVYISGNYGVGTLPVNRFQLHTIHGARVGECFSAGVGLGVDYYTQDFESGILMAPLFADIKLYAPTYGKFDPFLMVDVGYGLAIEDPSFGGLMFGAGLGFKAGVFAMSLGYHLQQLGSSGVSLGMSAVQLKLGFAF
ncbi:MAG: hypothetical protein J6U91_02000 [Alistipes sp.]|nr:hypothetical protein [Alistipes sp.]